VAGKPEGIKELKNLKPLHLHSGAGTQSREEVSSKRPGKFKILLIMR